MMNFVAICFVVNALVASGVWSPTPKDDQKLPNNPKEEVVVVKEGIRVVVVEYDQQGKHNTKVSIAPEQQEYQIPKSVSEVEEKLLSTANEKIKEASSVLPNLGQGLKYTGDSDHHHDRVHGPGELICDTYGKCKHKIASAIEKAKEKVSEVAHEGGTKKKEMEKDAYDKAKETAAEKARGVKESPKDALGKAKETASIKAKEMKEGAKETIKEARDVGKTVGEHVARNVSEQLEKAEEGTEHAAKRMETGIYSLFFDRFGKFFRSIGLPETLNASICVLNLLGFATAYGMSIWVTFISSYPLALSLPKQQFGIVQSKIYPVYFRAMAWSIGLALLGHMPHMFSSKAGMLQGYNLLASILMVFANSVDLEPLATKVMFERMKIEKEEGRGRESLTGETSIRATERRTSATDPAPATTVEGEKRDQEAVRTKMFILSKRLKKLNTWSSALNIATLMSLNWHLIYLAQRLHMSC